MDESQAFFQHLAVKEIELMAEHVWSLDANGPLRAICLYACDDADLEEAAYWIAIKLGAQTCEFIVVGDSHTLREIDKEYGNVTQWAHSTEYLPTCNVLHLTKEVMLKVNQHSNLL